MEKERMVMIREEATTITTSEEKNSSWKLYENPFYYSHSPQQSQQQKRPHHNHRTPYLLPSARKLAACLWDLTFIRSLMDSELDMARTKIHELRAELELERKARKKVESLNKKLCKQILEERRKREAVEDICEKLAKEIATEKLVMEKVKKDIVEERKMLKMAEVFREERVQMKLSEAKIFLEEKLSELESSKVAVEVTAPSKLKLEQSKVRSFSMNDSTTTTMSSSLENSSSGSNYISNPGLINKRRASPEPENPHIRRGIKGFVEFPRVVRAISSRGRQLGSKVECQKAQLRLLLRQNSPFRSTENIIMG